MNSKARLAEKLFCAGFFTLCAYLLLKYAIGALLPFAFAYLISLIISPISGAISKKMKLPIKLCAAVCVILSVALLSYLVYIGISRLAKEVELLLERMKSGEGEFLLVIDRVSSSARSFLSRFEFPSRIGGGASDGLSGAMAKLFSSLRDGISSFIGSRIPSALGQIISKAPQLFIGFFVTLMASYYFVADREKIREGIKMLLPKSARLGASRYLSKISYALRRYARGYLLLMLLTFIFSLIGLSVLGIKYSFIIALAIAVIDILPVLGSGTVLVPWAIVEFLIGNGRLGTGLLILYGVMTIIRQISEPKIIGDSIGLHPMASLFSMYVGLRLFGIWGMILSPAVALIIKETVWDKSSLA